MGSIPFFNWLREIPSPPRKPDYFDARKSNLQQPKSNKPEGIDLLFMTSCLSE